MASETVSEASLKALFVCGSSCKIIFLDSITFFSFPSYFLASHRNRKQRSENDLKKHIVQFHELPKHRNCHIWLLSDSPLVFLSKILHCETLVFIWEDLFLGCGIERAHMEMGWQYFSRLNLFWNCIHVWFLWEKCICPLLNYLKQIATSTNHLHYTCF